MPLLPYSSTLFTDLQKNIQVTNFTRENNFNIINEWDSKQSTNLFSDSKSKLKIHSASPVILIQERRKTCQPSELVTLTVDTIN